MKKVSLGMLAVSFMFVSLIAKAQDGSFQPVDLSSTSTCVIPKVDGERVPFPGRAMNAKFELAENESYLLNGTLTVSAGKVYLKVDFASQPWLETEKMKAHPYFEVTSLTVAQARQYARKLVQVAVVTSGDRTSGLTLSPILPPVLSER